MLLALSLTVVAQVSTAKQYPIDNNHSTVGFSVPILGGLSKVRGKFTDFAITLTNDEKDITKSSVNVVIKATSINTGIEGRDKHLRTADFFDVEKFTRCINATADFRLNERHPGENLPIKIHITTHSVKKS